MPDTPRPADPDTRDWTVVIDDGCSECGYVPHDPRETQGRILALPERWMAVLARKDARDRPKEGVWSPVEYACHSRDLLRVLRERVTLILDEDNPTFPDYDGEAEAVSGKFWSADPDTTADEIAREAAKTASVFSRVGESDWEKAGLRGDGKRMSIAGLSRYLIHDLEHHLVDVDG